MTEPALKHIAIAGANGSMGALFLERFPEAGCSVVGLARPYTEDKLREALSECDMLMVCVPVTVMADVVQTMRPYLPEGCILADVGSVKEGPMRAMLENYDGPVVGTHPLFGPVIPDGFLPKTAIVPGRESDKEAAEKVYSLFEACDYDPFMTTAEEHDRAMAFIQGLNFTSTVAFLAATRDVQSIKNFVTPSFKRRLDAARKMLTMDTELFETISEANPYLQESNRKFMTYLSLAAGGDLELLSNRAKWWWNRNIR
ncbi:prephenate dehydrogenase/arogenate dehydrogenase family protein [Pseudodesulfovibrio cashew]|uniref:Prephenate dehydrogenase/arogenate dehydrogenase family protein n=1 Tax=Pseudodesulfovibrio cashew TaxID=2678688 RepID=A0A6I6J9W1_9BACT|nr:prephenate dehydrogenase [Pseudodesulfovibrio cashew]QGY38831.1 prephenate dehydrogenase/arogenate dehydrogenase family protein [Pseudodesulfovibrio cashew]